MKMSKYINRSFACYLLLLGPVCVGQDQDWRPSSLRAGVDVVGFGRTLLSDTYARQEFQADIDFNSYFLVVDVGREEMDHSGEGFNHTTNGAFYRVGIDVNMTPYNANRDLAFFGLRYAHASFDEALAFNYEAPYWGPEQVGVSNNGIASNWMEAVIGIKVKLWRQFYLGYTLRAKIFNNISGAGSLVPYAVPGYGVVRDSGNVGFGYHLYYRLAFRDKAVPLRPSVTKKTLK